MGYQISLNAQDIIAAAEASLMAAFNPLPEKRHKPRDPQTMLTGWMAQQAVGKYHYGDAFYDVRKWVQGTGSADTADGYEIRCNPLRNLVIRPYDRNDQDYWLIMHIKDHRFWLLGEVNRQDVQHLAHEFPYTDGWYVNYVDLIPHLQDVHQPKRVERMIV